MLSLFIRISLVISPVILLAVGITVLALSLHGTMPLHGAMSLSATLPMDP